MSDSSKYPDFIEKIDKDVVNEKALELAKTELVKNINEQYKALGINKTITAEDLDVVIAGDGSVSLSYTETDLLNQNDVTAKKKDVVDSINAQLDALGYKAEDHISAAKLTLTI